MIDATVPQEQRCSTAALRLTAVRGRDVGLQHLAGGVNEDTGNFASSSFTAS